MKTKHERVGELIAQSINEIISQSGGAEPDQSLVPDWDFTKFLKSPRGRALIFWSIDSTYSGRCFRAESSEWKQANVKDVVSRLSVFDCHTHFVGSAGTRPRAEIHPAPQYRGAARNNWWFFPECYRYPDQGDSFLPPMGPRLESKPHGHAEFVCHMREARATMNDNFEFLATPAPRDETGLGGEGDLVNYTQLRIACDELNTSAPKDSPWCWPTGVIRTRFDLGRDPSLPLQQRLHPTAQNNPHGVWKLYSGARGGHESLLSLFDFRRTSALREVLSGLDINRHSELVRRQTVFIHWWDGESGLVPSPSNIGRIAGENRGVNFVLFHACYPHFRQLTALLNDYPNLYVEIGGTFANQILGGSGHDDDSPNLRGPNAGPDAAIEMIERLRGRKLVGDEGCVNDRKIIWGTDAIWHGSPVWQIEAFWRLNLDGNLEMRGDEERFKKLVLKENARRAGIIPSQLRRD